MLQQILEWAFLTGLGLLLVGVTFAERWDDENP